MPIKSHITDPNTGKIARVDATEGECRALVTATRPLKIFKNKIEFFTNPTFGVDMNRNVGFGANPEEIHNGLNNVYWTASAISGIWTFNAAAPGAGHGTQSIDCRSTVDTDTAQFVRPAGNISLDGYTSITGFIWLTTWDNRGTKHVQFYGWDATGNAQVGVIVNIDDYINIGTIGAWQKFTIPLADMGLTGLTLNAFRIMTVDILAGLAPDYYLDDMQIEEAGGAGDSSTPIEFKVEPAKEKWLHIHGFTIIMADNSYDSTGTGTETLPAIPYDQLLGVAALANGVVFQGIIDDEITFAVVLRQLSDLMQVPGTKIDASGAAVDGTDTWITIGVNFTHPTILKSEHLDRITATVSDDLSGLDLFRVAAYGGEEDRIGC